MGWSPRWSGGLTENGLKSATSRLETRIVKVAAPCFRAGAAFALEDPSRRPVALSGPEPPPSDRAPRPPTDRAPLGTDTSVHQCVCEPVLCIRCVNPQDSVMFVSPLEFPSAGGRYR
jgi:hypothetical protein